MRMKIGRSKKPGKTNVSQNDWCFATITNGPVGIFSTPRNSTLMLQTARIRNSVAFAHHCATVSMARGGNAKVGSATIARHTSTV
ncbi:hypothetical protein ACVWWK_002413 [Bradyrhizobium sp. LB9.1b]